MKKSKVNEAGNYTKPTLRKRLFNEIKSAAVQGTAAGQWSAQEGCREDGKVQIGDFDA